MSEMTPEMYIKIAADANALVGKVIRKLSTMQMVPEFSSKEMTVQDAADLIGLPAESVRAGILNGWLPIGVAVRNGKEVKEAKPGCRMTFYISPRKVWEETGHIWRGRKALKEMMACRN